MTTLTRIRRDTIRIPQGDDWGIGWPVYTNTTPPVLVSVAGWRVRSQIRSAPGSDAILFEWDSGDMSKGRAVAEDGMAKLFLTPDDSDPWTFESGELDVKVLIPSVGVKTLVRAHIEVVREITRWT